MQEKIKFVYSKKYINYNDAINEMKTHMEFIQKNETHGIIWGLEHNHVYTKGVMSKNDEFLENIEFCETSRGGKATYHGPGQLVVYTMINLKKYKKDIVWFVNEIEKWMFAALGKIGLNAFNKENQKGAWVRSTKDNSIKKIGFIGIGAKKWITWHGFSINVDNDILLFDKIIPCGEMQEITSVKKEEININCHDLFQIIKNTCPFSKNIT